MKIRFYLLMMKAFNAYKSKARPHMANLGLSVGQPKILGFLSLHDGCMQKDLAKYCNIEPATVSRLLGAMIQSGLIERQVDDTNRRAVHIFITKRGKAAHRQMERSFEEVDRISLAGFSEAEKAQLTDYLRRIDCNLTAEE